MEPRLAPATDPLRGEQASLAEQPQHSLAAHPHAVLTGQPSPHLAVALASERRGEQHPTDQPQQITVADRGGRARPDWLAGMAAGVERGARRAEHAAHHHRHW
jgi:hypothetical protein